MCNEQEIIESISKQQKTSEKLSEYKNLVRDVTNFCKESTVGRDVTHNHEHMTAVRENATRLYKESLHSKTYEDYFDHEWTILYLLTAAAQFHDIMDHKYIEYNSIQYKKVEKEMSDLLLKYLTKMECSAVVDLIIPRISYSWENKMRNQTNNEFDVTTATFWNQYFVPTSTNPFDVIKLALSARHFVSDADKHEAIGVKGSKRCEAFARERHPDASDSEINKMVIEHHNEKLLRLLPDGFFQTKAGIKAAKPLHDEMVEYVDSLCSDQVILTN